MPGCADGLVEFLACVASGFGGRVLSLPLPVWPVLGRTVTVSVAAPSGLWAACVVGQACLDVDADQRGLAPVSAGLGHRNDRQHGSDALGGCLAFASNAP